MTRSTDCEGHSFVRTEENALGAEAWIPVLPEKTLLQVAEEIINGPRADDYGPAHVNLGRLAVRWSQVVGVPVSIEQVGLMMADLKICRLIHSPNHYDSWVDLAGYPGVVDKAWRGE